MFSSVKSKIITWYSLLFACSAIVIGVAAYYLIIDSLLIKEQENIELVSRQQANNFDTQIRLRKMIFANIATGTEPRDYARSHNDAMLLTYFEKFKKEFPVLSYVDEEGIETIKNSYGKKLKSYEDVTKDFTIKRAKDEPNTAQFTLPSFRPGIENTSAIIKFALENRSFFDEHLGLVVGEISWFDFTDNIRTLQVGETGFAVLIDSKGNMLCQSTSARSTSQPIAGEDDRSKGLFSKAMALESGVGRATIMGIDGLVAYYPSEVADVSVLAVLPYEEFVQAPTNVLKLITAIMVGVLALIFLFSLGIANNIVRPLIALKKSARKVSMGDYSERVIVESKDEIAELANSFNEMVVAISTITDSLKNSVKMRDNEIMTRKRVEEELRVASIAAIEANQAKSQFLANMSHEIRTPLNGIIGIAELLSETELDEYQKQFFKSLLSESKNLNNLISSILDLAKIEAGKMGLDFMPFNFQQFIDDVVTGFTLRAELQGLEFDFSMDPDVPGLLIGDPGRLRQIVVNLTGNAIKFTRNGTVSLKVGLESHLDAKVKLRFTIQDTGIGIPKEKQARIFDNFTQIDGSITREFGGTGIGTNIAKNLAKLMGGDIGFSSEAGQGATFWFTACFEVPTDPAIIEKQRLDDARKNKCPQLEKAHILVVEDYKTNQLVLMQRLKKVGCQLEIAENGQIALEFFNKQSFDLILMDVNMPVMDGLTATKLIREVEKTRGLDRTPIVALTAHAFASDRERCIDAGMDDYLKKPIQTLQLYSVLNKWLPESPATSASDAPIDYEEVLRIFSNDEALVKQVLDQYLKDTGKQVETLKDALKKQDSETVRKEAHAIKGGALDLTDKDLAEAALKMEKMGKSGNLAGGQELLDEIKIQRQRLEIYVKSIV